MYRRQHYPARRNTNAFTLIEILVVIVIIGLLTALLLPVFAVARRKVNETVCLSNLRQIGQALLMYQQDYNGRMPLDEPLRHVNHNSGATGKGENQLKANGATADVLRCPEQSGPGYQWRIRFDLRHAIDPKEKDQPDAPPSDKNHKRVRHEPNSVVAYCYRHLTEGYQSRPWGAYTMGPGVRKGIYLVLRADGTAQRVPAGQVMLWDYERAGDEDKWYRVPWGPGDPHPSTFNTVRFDVFPNEPWPPKFEQ